MLVPAISHLCWDQLTRSSRKLKTCTVRNALKLRHGTFWNAKWARCSQQPYPGKESDGNCPFCRNPDSGTRVLVKLGACTHRLVQRFHIERHNEAVATAGKAIMEGTKGGCLAAGQCWMGWQGHRRVSDVFMPSKSHTLQCLALTVQVSLGLAGMVCLCCLHAHCWV